MAEPARRRRSRADRAAVRVERRRAAMPSEIRYPPDLPVSERREDLLAAIEENQVVVVAGETGSGKTTQLPKLCLELGRGIEGQIAHTQPRRLAARTVAGRIADELGVPLGGAVGYGVRFEERSRDETLVRLMTDGLLLAEIQRDRVLRRYDTVIVDEAHERSLNIDFLLGCLHRILPQRPDLKLIITSATIDPERFSRHFGAAPIIEVSGRTYPVEIRYRPLVEDLAPAGEADEDETADDADGPAREERDLQEAIGEAVEELFAADRGAPGDVLVFLSGEREIRDTADHLEGRLGPTTEILPLYARLSSAEQQRVFRRDRSGAKRRVVLATNVAETSLTVPGIKYVVDPGTARISRYSSRLKVQRLPIEPVSQASAAQRAGRCGRTSDGICIRLYSESDHDHRPEFTDPEILRTSLAAVILQMAALGLGEIEDFPFLEPPDRRQIRDGVRLLEELGALDPKPDDPHSRLTPLGRRLARLPVDPRFGRMVLEADRLRCAEEVVVIAAALSIQDPRERPVEKRAQADQLHARFRHEDSDFLSYLELWRHLEERQRELSRTRFRKECRAEFLHHLRIREWQDLAGQLRQAAKGVDVTFNEQPAEPRDVHVALLSGLLSHIGLRDASSRDYLGARGARFAIFPGSTLARRGPPWVVVAELVETSRLWGRTAAKIEPRWIEPLAGHLLRRTYSEPRWDASGAQVVATESATLYGLPVVKGRTLGYGAIDPELARDLFIRRALVEGDWEARHDFIATNRRTVAALEALEERSRRRGLLAGDDRVAAFFEERIPAEVVSGGHFERWWRDARRADPHLLDVPRDVYADPTALAALDPKGFPTAWKQGETLLDVRYRFEPGDPDDGMTVEVPLALAAGVEPAEFEWLVPGLRHELVVALLRGLPKDLRRPLVPVPDLATEILAAVRPRRERLRDAVGREVERLRGVRVPPQAWPAPDALPDHLRPAFRIVGPEGEILAAGEDLVALRAALAPQLRARLTAATPELERTGLTSWTIGTLPREVEVPGSGGAVRGHPALVDEGEAAGVRVLDSAEAQARAMRAGTRRLLLLAARGPLRSVRDGLGLREQVALADAPLGGLDAAIRDAAGAAVDILVQGAGGPAWDEAAFGRLRGAVLGELAEETERVLATIVGLCERRAEAFDAILALSAPGHADTRSDLEAQLARLVHAGFATSAGAARLADIDRYLRAMVHRAHRAPADPRADAGPRETVARVAAEIDAATEAWPADRALPEALRELPWLVEELRVSVFAQALGTRVPVSEKRIRRALAEAITP